jgi:hypothetical protein
MATTNASKKWSGTHKELEEKRKKLERVAERIVQRHRERDGQEGDSAGASSEPEKAQRYRRKVAEIKAFLEHNDKKYGPTGNDSGFHSKTALAAVEATGADAYIADRDYRRRDPAFAQASRYKQRDKKERSLLRRRERESRQSTKPRLFTVQDFLYDEANALCILSRGAEALLRWQGHALQWLSRRQIQSTEDKRFSVRTYKSPQTDTFLLESSTMEEGGACTRFASGFFYGLAMRTQSPRLV